MKIAGVRQKISVDNRHDVDVFILSLNTNKTGDIDKDYMHIASDFSSIKNSNNPKEILDFLIPMLTELVHKSYGETK